MRLDEVADLLGATPWFDLPTVAQLSGEPRRDVVNQLYRWSRAGKVIPLRRGMYALADRYRRVPVPPATLANALYFPSYLSGHWALGFYGLIPEAVPVYTSPSLTCAVERRCVPAGANPARQLSLQPEAVGAVQGGNELH